MATGQRGRDEEGDLPPDGLPLSALRRVRRQRQSGTWNSDLSVPELAAIRSAGFTPAGLVMGCSIYRVAWQGISACWTPPDAWSPMVELAPYERALEDAQRLALRRLRWEAAELGSHGVVGVRLQVRHLDRAPQTVEFSAIGTAVRREGAAPLARPFLSALDGQGLAKLLRMGLVPCGLAIGVAAMHVHTNEQVELQMEGVDTEVGIFSRAGMAVRWLAMQRLARASAAARADGCVGSDLRLDVWRVRCDRRWRRQDHIVQFTAVATAVARFEATARSAPGMVVSLSR